MARVKTAEKRTVPVAVDECHHYWIIEVANGPTSEGVCKHCGETKIFYNSMPDFSVPKRDKSPLELPEMTKVALDKDSSS